jgi:hypothetical protein
MKQNGRAFPIMVRHYEVLNGPRSVPWGIVAPFEDRARKNHGGQSLERLAERGGLSPCELLCVLIDRDWTQRPTSDSQDALDAIAEILESYR